MKIEVKVPNLGESITEATVCEIIQPDGSTVKMDDEIIELETEKVNQVLNAPESGYLKLDVKVDDHVKVGQVIGYIETEVKSGEEKQKIETEETEVTEKPSAESESKVSEKPKTDKISQDKQLPKDNLRTTRKRISKLRKVISKKLVEVKNQTAMLTTFNEVNMEKIIEFRRKEQPVFLKKHLVKLGFMSFFIKACILALKKFPEINAYLDQDEIVYQNFYDIGIAVGTEKGLFVPVLKDCDKMNFAAIEKKLNELAEKARNNQISIEELTGGSFTITNGGVYGSLLSTPILNPPQSGILGMHTIQKRPIAFNDEVIIKPMMYLALSYDHRIVDGKEAIGFLTEVKDHLEEPIKILIDF